MKRLLSSTLSVLLCVVAALALMARSRTPGSRLPFNTEHELRKHRPRQTPVILYHGGPVMISGKSLYVIYYGSFTVTQHSILDTFLQNLGGSGAFNVNSEYYDAQNMFIQNVLNYSPNTDSYDDNYSLGTKLSGSFASTLVGNAISGGHLPADANGIYILSISPDVSIPKSTWCAYHTHSTSIVSGTDIKYAVAPDPPSSLYSGCSGNVANYGDTTSPNGDIGMDAVADDLIHEISETVTDPDLSAWYTKNGAENADLCNFVYGATFLAPNGSHANHTFGTRNYLWDRIGSFCALSH
ncbi:MAG: hypothetical protein DMG88_06975 [Acidobacteria bacterium]|nr:MAG: hypothetical protein DMG88_06975 [Acidobacteriota bacterium]